MAKLIEEDPLAGTAAILATKFYGTGGQGPSSGEARRASPERDPVVEAPAPPTAAPVAAKPPKPTHYKVVCISLYTEDIERLEALVADLKGRGHTKANKSAVIRYALDAVDISKMPKGY